MPYNLVCSPHLSNVILCWCLGDPTPWSSWLECELLELERLNIAVQCESKLDSQGVAQLLIGWVDGVCVYACACACVRVHVCVAP